MPLAPKAIMSHVKSSLQVPVKWACIMGLLTGLATLFVPNQYTSNARILPADQRSGGGLGGAAAAAAAAGVNIPGQESADSAYVDILNSRALREELLNTRFTFKVRSWYFGAWQDREQTLYEYLDKNDVDLAVNALNDQIFISRDLKTKLITISVESKSPQLSQAMAQSMVRFLNEFVVGKSQTKGGTKAAFSEKRLLEAREEMAQAEEAFRAFLDGNRNYTLSPDPAIRLKGQRLENELKLRTQLVTTLAISREQALLEEKNDMPILNVLDAANLPIQKSRPARAVIVALISSMSGVAVWSWLNRDWVRSRLSFTKG